jgi:hypothetical protein
MLHVVIIIALTCCLAAATQAGDEPLSFRTPSGNILCGFRDVEGEQAIRCDIIKRKDPTPLLPMPADCDADWGNMFVIGGTGQARLECAGDLAADPSSPQLDYGNVTKQYGITCLSDKAGLTCINGEGHGFILSRAKQELF